MYVSRRSFILLYYCSGWRCETAYFLHANSVKKWRIANSFWGYYHPIAPCLNKEPQNPESFKNWRNSLGFWSYRIFSSEFFNDTINIEIEVGYRELKNSYVHLRVKIVNPPLWPQTSLSQCYIFKPVLHNNLLNMEISIEFTQNGLMSPPHNRWYLWTLYLCQFTNFNKEVVFEMCIMLTVEKY